MNLSSAPMRLVSVNVSRPQPVAYGETSVMTGIFKTAVAGPVAVGRFNLAGDGQADLIHHGGESKAVYAYSLDHYAYWRETLACDDLPLGQFGENLTVAGLDESRSCLGDQLQIGSARFTISQPRVPCFKLGIRFSNARLPQMFALSLRTGFYLRVSKEGAIAAGDPVELTSKGDGNLSIRSLFDAYLKPNISLRVACWRAPSTTRRYRRNGVAISPGGSRRVRTPAIPDSTRRPMRIAEPKQGNPPSHTCSGSSRTRAIEGPSYFIG